MQDVHIFFFFLHWHINLGHDVVTNWRSADPEICGWHVGRANCIWNMKTLEKPSKNIMTTGYKTKTATQEEI